MNATSDLPVTSRTFPPLALSMVKTLWIFSNGVILGPLSLIVSLTRHGFLLFFCGKSNICMVAIFLKPIYSWELVKRDIVKWRIAARVFSEVPFWNSVEYGIVYRIGFISRNSAKCFTVQFRGIPDRFVYTEFRIPSNLATAFCIMQPGVKSKNFGRLSGPLKGLSGEI